MALPTREELLAHVEFRFRELAPEAPVSLDSNDPAHATMIRQWHQAHHEVLSKMTDEAFFGFFPQAPARLDPASPEHATFIEYWNDIAAQIDGRSGRYNCSNPTGSAASASTADAESGGEQEEIGSNLAGRCRMTLARLQPISCIAGLEIRTHATPLYTSMFRADDTLIANPHLYGAPASDNPALVIRRDDAPELWHDHLLAFQRVWNTAHRIRTET